MKSFDEFNKDIDKYYEGSLDGAISENKDLKDALDKMSCIENIEEEVKIPINLDSIVEQGLDISFKKKLKKSTFEFLILSILISIIVGVIGMKISFEVVLGFQFILLIILLILNTLLLKRRKGQRV